MKNNISNDYQFTEYEINNRVYTPGGRLKGIKCINYELCKTLVPCWWHQVKGYYACDNCYMMYSPCYDYEDVPDDEIGTLPIEDEIECSFCKETLKCVLQPYCDHKICFACYKKYSYREKSPNNHNCYVCYK